MNIQPTRIARIRARLQSVTASVLLAVTLLSPVTFVAVSASVVVLATPQAVSAQIACVNCSTFVQDAVVWIRDFVKEGLVGAAKVGIKNALRSFLEKIAYDTAVWIGSGDENQKPLLFTKDVLSYLKEEGDAAAGEVLNTIASDRGFASMNLCDLPSIEKLKFQLILPRLLATEPAKNDCTFTEIASNVSDYATNIQEQAQAFMDNPRSLVDFSASLDDGNNALSSLLVAVNVAIGAKTEAERAAEIERQKSDFKDQQADISGYVQTPAAIIGAQVGATINQATQGETIQQDNIIADALGVFVNTLSSKLLSRATSGLLSFFTEAGISDSISGNSSTVGNSAGIKGAQEQFASFRTPSFTIGGTVDILSQFASCPEQGADVVNCVVDENLRLAIDEGLSVQEAINQGILDGATPFGFDANGAEITNPTLGISLRNMKILKQYSVVPVGWVLAAQYNQDFDGSALTLQGVVDDFAKCEQGNYSPYCGLVDPNWILKAPDVFCKVQGYGENIASTQFVDADGNQYTPEQKYVGRLSSCLDSQSCLTEDDNGACTAYGYCTAQKDIYRFEGDSCPAYNASCELFLDAAENEVAYLKNTLNYNDCTADNAGCQWYCTQYNEVDSAFRCADQGVVYSECSTSGGCSCTEATSGESCTVLNGGFKCSTNSGAVCTLGTEPDATSGVDSAISFDQDVQFCDSDEAGCSQYLAVKGGSNLLFNASFEDFNTFQTIDTDALNALGKSSDTAATAPYDDTFGFYGTDGDGQPCTASSGSKTCYGWELLSGATARAVGNSLYGSVAMQLADTGSGAGYISTGFETNRPLENRSFVLSYNYSNPSTADCVGQYWVRPDGATTPAAVDVTYRAGSSYTQVVSDAITFADGISTTTVRVGITQPTGCALVLDAVKLEENSASSGYTEYGAEPVYINTSVASSCTAAQVGCEMYTPQTGGSTLEIPGIITNPLSDICGNGSDFSNPACSQCEQQYVGCESYIPQPTPYAVPIKDIGGFSDPLDTSAAFTALADAVATRTGYYCEGTETACSPERETLQCGATTACLPALSIVPTTGTSCSAANVGCEEYVNLDEQSAGGEGLEYYTYIRQCVQPTQDQITANTVATYYTFEGSDVSGYQIRSWYLKASDDVAANGGAAPCTNLDLYGSSAQTVAADCIDTQIGAQDCAASDVGVNPDCTEYYDTTGTVYYRLASATITVSESCQELRNSTDQRIYYSIPEESTSCPATANLCTEFKGSSGSAAKTIVDENFDTGAWSGGESSSTVVTANTGLSMALGTATSNASTQASVDVSAFVDVASSYIVTFWAKADTNGAVIYPYFASASAGTTNYIENAGVALTTEWKPYTVGPFTFSNALAGDEVFGFEYTGATAYVDNAAVSESSSRYLIRGTSDLCPGYEGCQKYQDTEGDTQYLKSFTGLCEQSVVGCEAVIDTQNSDNPFYQKYNGDNEYSEDDVIIGPDQVTNYAVTDSVLCGANGAGCTHMGQPEIDASGSATAYTDVYVLNDPDNYTTTLCQEQQLQCEAYTTQNGSVVYFKDPGEKVCSYDSSSGSWKTPSGDPCPLQNADSNATPSQPKGPICTGGLRSGDLCSADTDCPAAEGDGAIYRCSSTVDDQSGWAGSCSQQFAGCTQYVDPVPESAIQNGSFETDIQTNSDITAGVADGVPDHWVEDNTFNAFFVHDFAAEGALAAGHTVGCSVFASATSPVFDRANALQLQGGAVDNDWCIVKTEKVTAVDPNEIYTLSGNVYVTDPTDRFSMGLLFYDADGKELNYKDSANTITLDVEDSAFAAFSGGSRSGTTTLPTGQWMRFYGVIGPNLEHSFPEGTYFVKVFLEVRESGTDSVVTFDNVVFGKNDTYTYINESVDGAAESDKNSCAGSIDENGGCVAFRDTTSNQLTDLTTIEQETGVNSGYTVNTCTFNSGVPSEGCNSLPNTADANTVIKVRNDRQCSEWLSCTDARPNYDAAGNLVSSTCFAIGSCIKRNEDTGVCIEYAPQPTTVGYDDDMSVTSQPGDTTQLLDIQNASGFVDVGVEWNGVCVSNTCEGGANNGQSCSADSDCDNPNIEYGYYPENWMTQKGLGGAQSTVDVVKDGDFESVYCDGESTYSGVFDATQMSAIEYARDTKLKCTTDTQCRTTDAEAKAKSLLEEAGSITRLDTVTYSDGWCSNVDTSGSWTGRENGTWESTAGASLKIVDYDPTVNTMGIGTANIDLNNVMHVTPASGAQSGIASSLAADAIVQGQEYTISFDAQYLSTPNSATDFIQVGLQHGSGTDTDFFEVGSPMADITVIVDASSSMGGYIANASSAVSSLVSSLETAGVNYQAAIVTTGGSRTARPVDFTDYTGGAGTDYGATNGISRDFTSDSSEFSNALNTIANSLDSGTAYNYEALANVAENNFDLGSGYQLNFRPGAVKFVILLTDVAPESGDDYIVGGSNNAAWDEDDETNLITSLGAPYVLYAITTGSAASAYDNLVEQMGGTLSDITSSNYDTLLASIADGMSGRVSSFTFDTTYHRYTLGPIVIENKNDVNDSSSLFIRQTTGSSNAAFVIDNISLLPALEVNKENNPAAADSSWLISRECRGYPAQDSLFCDYTDKNGAIYSGWKGYCMQHDDYDAKKCVAWWPIDIIAGESDSTSRTKVQYTGKFPVYQCLVAKGNADLGACYNTDNGTDGLLCTENANCSGGGAVCMNDGDTYDTPAEKWTGGYGAGNTQTIYNVKHEYTIDGYVMKHTISSIYIDSNDPHAKNDECATCGDHEYAYFHEFSAANGELPVERAVHMSEIDDLQFYMGDPYYTDNLSDNTEDQEWRVGEQNLRLRADLENNNMFVSVLKNDTADNSEGWHTNGCPATDPDCFPVYAYQKAAWCGPNADQVCSSTNSDDEWADMDLVFVKQVTAKTEDRTLENHVWSILESKNPFEEVSALKANAATWTSNSGRGVQGAIQSSNSVDGVTFHESFFMSPEVPKFSPYNEAFSDTPTPDDNNCWGKDPCGSSAFGVKFDFQDGYLSSVYLFYWDGFARFDVNQIKNIYWRIALREPCLLAVQSVDNSAAATPWMSRVSSTSTYRIPGLNMPYQMNSVGAVFGSLTLDNTTGDFSGVYDNVSTPKDYESVTGVTSTLPYVQIDANQGHGIPLACIGNCSDMACAGTDDLGFMGQTESGLDPSTNKYYSSYDAATSCSNHIVGVAGICSSTPDFCNDSTDCPTAGDACVAGDWSSKGVSGDSYKEQLAQATRVAWQRYREIFPTLTGGSLANATLYYAPPNSSTTGYSSNFNTYTPLSDNFLSWLNTSFDEDGDGTYDFEDMSVCSGADQGDSDYCAIRPAVSNITLNGNFTGNMEIANGATVSLGFDSQVDADQQPLQTIRIAWNGSMGDNLFTAETVDVTDPWEAASTTGHSYTHTYTCDPAGVYWNPSEYACQYKVKIQIEDNWSFCSGGLQTSETRGLNSSCTSYDEYDGVISVKP